MVSDGIPHQASAALELPSGATISVRLGLEPPTSTPAPATGAVLGATGAGGAAASGRLLQVLLQCDEPRDLWALRASLLRALVQRSGQRAIASPPAEGVALSRQVVEATIAEARQMLAHLRRWQLAHGQLHSQLSRLFERRRRFEQGAGSVSLRELSLEATDLVKRTLEMHQALRGHLNCLPLPIG